jgi:hypothetical protein
VRDGGQGKVAKEQIAKEKRKALDVKSAGTQHRHSRGKSPPTFSNPWGLLAITPASGTAGPKTCLLTQFAAAAPSHILPTHPKLWIHPRCSALGCEPEAPHNGQAIGSGQAAAPIHRIHHLNGHPVGGTKIRHAEEPVSAAGTALRSYYLWHQRSHSAPPSHSRRSRIMRACREYVFPEPSTTTGSTNTFLSNGHVQRCCILPPMA